MTPPVLMMSPGGNVPDASAEVKAPLPPVEASVVEYGTITATGSAVEVMTGGAIGIGGLPVAQERANPHRNTQIGRERALFNPLIIVLTEQSMMKGVRTSQSQTYRRRGETNASLRLTGRAVVAAALW
jgi:hypothetical protein